VCGYFYRSPHRKGAGMLGRSSSCQPVHRMKFKSNGCVAPNALNHITATSKSLRPAWGFLLYVVETGEHTNQRNHMRTVKRHIYKVRFQGKVDENNCSTPLFKDTHFGQVLACLFITSNVVPQHGRRHFLTTHCFYTSNKE
jgi:hypothetical protein